MIEKLSRYMVLTAALLLLLGTASPAGAGQVRTTPIPPPGADQSMGNFIDESGRVAGEYRDGTEWKIFLYDGTSFTDILPPGAIRSHIYDMNNSLGIVGESSDGLTWGYFLYSGGTFTDLGLPPDATSSSLRGIGDSGDVVGHAWYPGTNNRGWHYAGGTYTEVHPADSMWSSAHDVNSTGQVVGDHYDGTESRAFLFSEGSFSDPSPPSLMSTSAHTINNAGTILGWGWTDSGPACFMNEGGTAMVLSPPGSSWTDCIGLSENNTVVGWAQTGLGSQAFVYRDGSYQYLEARDRSTLLPWDINSSYQVTGNTGNPFIMNLRGASAREGLSGPSGVRPAPQKFAAPTDSKARAPIGEDTVAIIGDLLPAPAIRVGRDAMVGGNYAPKFSLTPWAYAGMNVEWWVIAQTPTRTYSYDVTSGAWVPGFFASLTSPLRKLPEVVLPPAAQELGIYTYYFGVDFLTNGIVDPKFIVYESQTVLHR